MDNKKHTRYLSGYISYKNVSCRLTEYEDKVISDYCRENNISKSLFLNCAAMYCIQNGISAEKLLECSINDSNFDYKELTKNEKQIQ